MFKTILFFTEQGSTGYNDFNTLRHLVLFRVISKIDSVGTMILYMFIFYFVCYLSEK
jgi:hypothetical protein